MAIDPVCGKKDADVEKIGEPGYRPF